MVRDTNSPLQVINRLPSFYNESPWVYNLHLTCTLNDWQFTGDSQGLATLFPSLDAINTYASPFARLNGSF